MASEASRLQVGIFVIAATVIGVGAAIWLGAARYFEDSVFRVTYFSESVQGLEPGAAVKFRGVPAGRVETIDIAPDGHLIEVMMSVDSEFAESLAADENLRAQLQLSGITGLRYVEIDRQSGDMLFKSPELSFQPAHPVIKSAPSGIKAIQDALEDIYERIMAVDLAGATNDMRATMQAADLILRDERVHKVLTNLADVSESAAHVTRNLDRLTGEVDLAPMLAELRATVAEARGVFRDLHQGATGTQLRQTLGGIEELAQATEQFVMSMQLTVERLDRTIANLQQLTDELRQQPSRLLFSEPPAAGRPAGPTER